MILLDTHILVWWVNGDTTKLSAPAASAIAAERNGGRIVISSITAWEIAMLVAHNRLALSMDVATWFAIVGAIDPVQFIPVDPEIAIKSVELPGTFHKDPADRLIVATARRLAIPVITADAKLHAYDHVRTIW